MLESTVKPQLWKHHCSRISWIRLYSDHVQRVYCCQGNFRNWLMNKLTLSTTTTQNPDLYFRLTSSSWTFTYWTLKCLSQDKPATLTSYEHLGVRFMNKLTLSTTNPDCWLGTLTNTTLLKFWAHWVLVYRLTEKIIYSTAFKVAGGCPCPHWGLVTSYSMPSIAEEWHKNRKGLGTLITWMTSGGWDVGLERSTFK